MTTYNGHKNWNHWNVSLWLMSDEGLYTLCRRMAEQSRTKDHAAHSILIMLRANGVTQTPDGAPFTFSSIRAAIKGDL